jgi:hypothetical protein
VSVEFELTPEEWVEVSLEHHERQPTTRLAMRNVRALLAALLLVVAMLVGLLGGAGSVALTWLLAGGVLLAGVGPLVRSAQRAQLRRLAEVGIANGTFGHHRVELREDGLLDSTEAYERLTRWPAIERVERGEGAFLVYLGPNAFMPIPYSAFRDAESLRRFGDAFYALQSGEGSWGFLASGAPPEPGPEE